MSRNFSDTKAALENFLGQITNVQDENDKANRQRIIQLCREAVEAFDDDETANPIRINILDNRGLTIVGRTNLHADGDYFTVENGRCIIRWGTQEHLAQIVTGPTNETKLGAAADGLFAKKNLVLSYLAGPGWKAVIDRK